MLCLWYCTFCARPLCIYTRRSPNTNHTYILYTYLPLTPLISQRVMRLLNKRQTKSISNETKAQNKQPASRLSVSQNNLQCHNNKETKMKLASSSCVWVYVCVSACVYIEFSWWVPLFLIPLCSALLCCRQPCSVVVCVYNKFLLSFFVVILFWFSTKSRQRKRGRRRRRRKRMKYT